MIFFLIFETMRSLEKQMDLMKRIPHIENEAILDTIESLLNQESEDVDQLTPKEEEKVLRGYQQYKDRDFKTSEEIEQKFTQWLEN